MIESIYQCVELCILAAPYARFKCSKYQKPGEDGSRALLRHVLTFGITGRTTFWSISHKDFFLQELSAILLWVSLDFQSPWHLSSQEIKKNLPTVVWCLWNMTHHPLQPGQWLLAFSAIRVMSFQQGFYCRVSGPLRSPLGKFSFVILHPFSFKHSLNINLVNSLLFGIFVKLTRSLSIVALTSGFLFPLVSTAGHSLAKHFSVAPQFSKFWRTLIVNRELATSNCLKGLTVEFVPSE